MILYQCGIMARRRMFMLNPLWHNLTIFKMSTLFVTCHQVGVRNSFKILNSVWHVDSRWMQICMFLNCAALGYPMEKKGGQVVFSWPNILRPL